MNPDWDDEERYYLDDPRTYSDRYVIARDIPPICASPDCVEDATAGPYCEECAEEMARRDTVPA